MNKRLAAIVLCLVLLAVTACGGSGSKDKQNEKDADAGATQQEVQEVEKYTPAVHEEGKYYVGIIQQAPHEALDLTGEGFRDRLSELLGEDVVIDYKVADGTMEDCDVIIDHFLQDKDDLILAVGTGALMRVNAATKDIPVVGAAVTDFIIAGGVSSLGEPGGNVTGVSGMPSVGKQSQLLMQLMPDDGTVGMLYCKDEVNSAFQCRLMEKYLDENDVSFKEYTFAGAEDMEGVISKAASECSVLYLPNDNVLAVNMDKVNQYAVQNGTRVFTSDGSMCKKGGLVSYGVDYYEVGVEAADMAQEILVYGGGDYEDEEDEYRGDPSRMEILDVKETASAWYNPVVAAAIGWTPDDTYSELDVEVPQEQTPAAKTAEESAQGQTGN